MAVAAIVAVVVAVTLVDQVHAQSRPDVASIDLGFAVQLRPLVSESTSTGHQLASLVGGMAGDNRVTLFEQLAAIDQQAAQTASAATGTTPPEPADGAGPACIDALQSRAQALKALQGAVEGLLGGSTGLRPLPAAAVTATLTAVGRQLQGADSRWQACRQALLRAPGRARVAASVWVANPSIWSASGVASLVASLSGSSTLAAAPGLAIDGFATTPPALAATGTQPIYQVAAADSLTVRVVVDNIGNVELRQVHVQVQAQPSGGAKAGPPVQDTVTLQPGTAMALTMSGLRVQPGGSYQLVARAGTRATTGTAAVQAPTDTVALSLAQAGSLTSVVPLANPVTVGARVVYQATVAGSLPGAGQPTGTVAFEDAGTPITGCAAQPLRRGLATCDVTYTSAGYHSITAVYGGTAALAGSTSPAITETVNPAPKRRS